MKKSYLLPYIEKMASRILNSINPDGGYPATKEGDESCPWTTASLPACAISVLGANSQDESKHHSTIQWLRQNDKYDGLFPMVLGTPPSIDTTAAVFEFLSRVQLGYTLEKGDYEYGEKIGNSILKAQKGGWSFLFEESEPLPFSTYWILRSLDIGKRAFPSLRTEIERAFNEAGNWLVSIKKENGWHGQSKKVEAACTATALLSLKLCNKIDQVTYDNFCDIIAKEKGRKIFWEDRVERHGGLTIIRFATPWCVAALSNASFPNHKKIIDVCIAEILDQIKDDKIFYKDTEVNTWSSRDMIICLSEVEKSPYSLPLSELLIMPYKVAEKEKEEVSPYKVQNVAYVRNIIKKNVKQTFRILHISDLHFGLYQKKRSEPLDSKHILTDLKKISKENIDAMIISGDITSNIKDGKRKIRHEIEFEEASSFIKGLIEGLKIPRQNVIIVPGNHDMDWEEAPYYIDEVHKSDVNYRNFYTKLFLKEPNEYLSMTFFDKNSNVGIMGLNSCLLCREKEKSWAGYVGDSQFNFTLKELTTKGCSSESFRIAVLHHHLVPVAYVEDVPAENKHLSLTLDAEGILKKSLQNRFDLVLHGHQHQPFCAIESRIYRGDKLLLEKDKLSGNESIIIIGAGSVGAPIEELGIVRRNLYNVIEISKDQVQVWTRETHPEEPHAFSYYYEYTLINKPLVKSTIKGRETE
jgi:3',5'-cyclic AMP phosphodiesterase CpdA/prenyltransferase beta subunit